MGSAPDGTQPDARAREAIEIPHQTSEPSFAGKTPLAALRRHWRLLLPGGVFLVMASGLAQSVPWLIKHAIDQVLGRPPAGGGNAAPLWTIASLIALVALLQAGTRILSRLYIFNAGRETEYELRRDLFRRLGELDAGFYQSLRTGDLMSRLTSDLSSVRALLGAGLLNLVSTVFAYAVALPLMVAIDPRLTLWALLPYPLLLLLARRFGRGIHARSYGLQRALGDLSASVEEDLSAWREVRTQAALAARAEQLRSRSDEVRRAALGLARWRAGLLPVVGLSAGISLVLVLAIGGSQVIEGRLSVGELVAFSLYIGLLAWPTLSVGWMLSLWQRGRASWSRLQEVLQARSAFEESGPLEAGAAPRLAALDGAPLLETRGLTLRLGGRAVLSELAVRVEPGSLCVLVGPVGAGKSTLAEAVARLLQVPAGTLFLDGVDVTSLPLAAVRRRVAYAPQSAFLFSASIRDNIAVGLPAELAGDSAEAGRRIEEAARDAGLEPELPHLPQGLDTLVGERGLSLSGGQRQRVALARALVSQRPLLVLDDSLSAVDTQAEQIILGRLGELLPRRTVLLISHRVAVLERADQILVLEEGRLVEAGRHAELLSRGGRYVELYTRQLLEEPGTPELVR